MKISRRTCTQAICAGAMGVASSPLKTAWSAVGETPIVNGAEHAWVLNDPRFPINPSLSNCPNAKPTRDYSLEHLLAEMQVHGIDKVVISHVCYYGTDNRYPIHCVQAHPDKFAAIGLLVGHRLHRPNDVENPSRLPKPYVFH